MAHWQAQEEVISPVGRRLHHASGVALGIDARPFAGEGHEVVLPTVTTASAGKAVRKVGTEHTHHPRRGGGASITGEVVTVGFAPKKTPTPRCKGFGILYLPEIHTLRYVHCRVK